MALDNKLMGNFTTLGDVGDATFAQAQDDNAEDFGQDSAGVPSGGISNKFMVGGSFGDSRSTYAESRNDDKEDFGQDSAGVPNVNQGESTDMDMNLAPNMFPRETGSDTYDHDELS